MHEFPNGQSDPDQGGGQDPLPSPSVTTVEAYKRGQEFLVQCPELLAAEVQGALSTLRGLDAFVEAWARDHSQGMTSADVARLARTVIASARARGEVAANLLKGLPSQSRSSYRGPRQEA